MKYIFISLLIITFFIGFTGAQIIDMHMHVYNEEEYGGGQKHHMGPDSPDNVEEFYNQIIELMNKHNIEYALISGSPETIKEWKSKDKRFLGGYQYSKTELIDTIQFKKLIEEGVMDLWAEMGSVYMGETLADPKFDPYIRICERNKIPIGYHTGNTNPGTPWKRPFRLANSDPLKAEDVLAKYPNLKIYFMHAGATGCFDDVMIELMHLYPNLYVDISVSLWVEYKTLYQVKDFLKKAKDARLLDRIMFGSDQMYWPEAITLSIDYLNSIDFLTKEEKHKIFYENAKKFLGL